MHPPACPDRQDACADRHAAQPEPGRGQGPDRIGGRQGGGSVSKKTHWVVAGDEAGSKLDKARGTGRARARRRRPACPAGWRRFDRGLSCSPGATRRVPANRLTLTVAMPAFDWSTGQAAVVAVFAVVYLGMILGSLPWLSLDRTGVALLGAIAVIGLGAMTPEQARALGAPADDPAAVLVHGDLGADAPGRDSARSPPHRRPAVAGCGTDGCGDRRVCWAVGGVLQRHRVPGGGAGAGPACLRRRPIRCRSCWHWPVRQHRPRRPR